MMRRSLLATPVALAAVLLVGGCHRGGSEDVTPSAKPSTATTGVDTAAAGAASAAGAARDTTAAAAAGMHDSMAGAAGAVHDSAAVKADSAMKHDSM
jgi:hypothetical protein